MQRSNPIRCLTRRRFGALAGCAAAAAILPLPAQAQRERELNIYCWEGYDSSNVLEPFRQRFNCQVRSERNTSDAIPQILMRSSAYEPVKRRSGTW